MEIYRVLIKERISKYRNEHFFQDYYDALDYADKLLAFYGKPLITEKETFQDIIIRDLDELIKLFVETIQVKEKGE